MARYAVAVTVIVNAEDSVSAALEVSKVLDYATNITRNVIDYTVTLPKTEEDK